VLQAVSHPANREEAALKLGHDGWRSVTGGALGRLPSRPALVALPGLALMLAGLVLLLAPSVGGAQAPACAAGPERSGALIEGTPCADVIVAPLGVETVLGGGGGDTIYVTPAARAVEGGEGDDTIVGEIPVSVNRAAATVPLPPSAVPGAIFAGGSGDDLIYATDFVIEINGGDGDDELWAESPRSLIGTPAAPPAPPAPIPPTPRAGSATASQASAVCAPDVPGGPFYCGTGNQIFDGEEGADIVFGERGNDTLRGGDGNDLLYGGIGDDVLRGEADNDLVSGGFGFDDVHGQTENDLVRGDGSGDAALQGGVGTDTLSFSTGVTPGFDANPGGFFTDSAEKGVWVELGSTVETRFARNGEARYGGGTEPPGTATVAGPIAAGFENVIGTPFDDYIVGSDGANTIYAGGGADVVLGGDGSDTLYGGAAGDRLDGGPDGGDPSGNALDGGPGSDYCVNPTTASCERSPANDPDGGLVLRDQAKISVGFMHESPVSIAPGASFSQLYLSGSSDRDNVTVAYQAGTPDTVTFDANGALSFDTTPDATTAGCTYAEDSVTCTLPAPLDAIVIAGMAADDVLTANGFPTTASVVVLGGEGGDRVSDVGDASEDVLVDGTGSGNDQLDGGGRSDAVLNNEGTDTLSGGSHPDLVLSASICGADSLGGGEGDDNASWARLEGTGVAARLDTGTAISTTSTCDIGADQLTQIEDLEGSNTADSLTGDGGGNDLLGRAGADLFFGLGGIDRLNARSSDADQMIDCGPPKKDVAFVDPLPLDPASAIKACESVQRA
jgi:Ca2+-binding RTX toxin-like protein